MTSVSLTCTMYKLLRTKWKSNTVLQNKPIPYLFSISGAQSFQSPLLHVNMTEMNLEFVSVSCAKMYYLLKIKESLNLKCQKKSVILADLSTAVLAQDQKETDLWQNKILVLSSHFTSIIYNIFGVYGIAWNSTKKKLTDELKTVKWIPFVNKTGRQISTS